MPLLQTLRHRYMEFSGKILFPAATGIFTHLTPQEKYILNRLAKRVSNAGGKVFLEIGSYLGASSVVIASALSRTSQRLYCVDTWQNDGMSEGKRDTYSAFIANTSTLSQYIVPLRGRSGDVVKKFNEEVDYIFFDGDHTYAGVKEDVDAWMPKLRSSGVVIFHDYGWAEGVIRVVRDEIIPRAINTGSVANMFWATIK